MLEIYEELLEVNKMQAQIIEKAIALLLLHVPTEDEAFCEIMNMREEIRRRESEVI